MTSVLPRFTQAAAKNVFGEDLMDVLNRELTKAHLLLLNHKDTRFYSGSIMMGKSEIVDNIPTARTDGKNKEYGFEFCAQLPHPELVGTVLHENLHVALKHILRYRDLMAEDAHLANVAMDYVVNGLIAKVTGYGIWIKLPKVAEKLYNPKFDGWSVREIYNFLKNGRNKDGQQKPREERYESNGGKSGGQPQPQQPKDKTNDEDEGGGEGEGEGENDAPKPTKVVVGGEEFCTEQADTHDHSIAEGLDDEGLEKLTKEIDEALHQAGVMAGVMGLNVPQAVREAMAPPVDWTRVMAEFVSNAMAGKDDRTWKRLDRRKLMDDIIAADSETEELDEIIACIDTSGSTVGPVLDKFCATLSAAASACSPKCVRILFWDTQVRGEQVFIGAYETIREQLKPMGGGGTNVTSVSKYIIDKGYKADCVIVLTDGYVESDPQWLVQSPTLWVVTERKGFIPPSGRMVLTNN